MNQHELSNNVTANDQLTQDAEEGPTAQLADLSLSEEQGGEVKGGMQYRAKRAELPAD